MTIAEILNELPKLTREEREEIRQRIIELDGDDWTEDDDSLTDEDKAMIGSNKGYGGPSGESHTVVRG